MKHKHMFSLLDQTFTTCHVRFDAEIPVTRAGKERLTALRKVPVWENPDLDRIVAQLKEEGQLNEAYVGE